MIDYRRRGLRIGEVYFDDEAPVDAKGLDVLRIVSVLEPRTERAWTRADTLVVDLTADEETLLAGMAKGTRYEVRRAMTRDGLTAEALDAPEPAQIEEFQRYYDQFAGSRGLAPVFAPRLFALAEDGMLVLTRVAGEDGSTLAWHAYAGSRPRAVLLYSASPFREHDDKERRSLMGRANRYLHWSDMRSLKSAGYMQYDLGGIDVAGRDPTTTRIAAFKRGFGGELRATHTASSAASLKGRLALALLRRRGVDF